MSNGSWTQANKALLREAGAEAPTPWEIKSVVTSYCMCPRSRQRGRRPPQVSSPVNRVTARRVMPFTQHTPGQAQQISLWALKAVGDACERRWHSRSAAHRCMVHALT